MRSCVSDSGISCCRSTIRIEGVSVLLPVLCASVDSSSMPTASACSVRALNTARNDKSIGHAARTRDNIRIAASE
jgi:hypothetical protein